VRSLARSLARGCRPPSARDLALSLSLSLSLSRSLSHFTLSQLAGRESRLFTVFGYIAYLRARKLQSIKGSLAIPTAVPRDIDLANRQHRALFAAYGIQTVVRIPENTVSVRGEQTNYSLIIIKGTCVCTFEQENAKINVSNKSNVMTRRILLFAYLESLF